MIDNVANPPSEPPWVGDRWSWNALKNTLPEPFSERMQEEEDYGNVVNPIVTSYTYAAPSLALRETLRMDKLSARAFHCARFWRWFVDAIDTDERMWRSDLTEYEFVAMFVNADAKYRND